MNADPELLAKSPAKHLSRFLDACPLTWVLDLHPPHPDFGSTNITFSCLHLNIDSLLTIMNLPTANNQGFVLNREGFH